MNGSERRLQVMCVYLLALATLMVPQVASGEDELSGLSEVQILGQIHREAYREEFFRRLADYSAEEREAAMERFVDGSSRRRFPEAFGDDELLDLVLNSDDASPVYKALKELDRRYETASPEAHTALATFLREAYQVTPYPILLPDMSNSAEASANMAAYGRIDRAVQKLLPTELVLAVFREVYLESGHQGAITAFVSRISQSQICGPATRAILEELKTRTATYDREKLDALGEHEAVESIIYMAIRGCSDNSFEAVKARDWQNSDMEIYTMGTFDNPEARKLLLDFYDTIPKQRLSSDKRLRVLGALILRWNREDDGEVRALLRRELTDLLNMDHNVNPYWIYKTAEVIEQTRDPYYLPLLRKRLANLEPAAIQRASASPEDEVEKTIHSVEKQLNKAIAKLESVQSDQE